MSTLLPGEQREQLTYALDVDHETVRACALRVREALAALNGQSANPDLLEQLDLAARHVDAASERLSSAKNYTEIDGQIPSIVFLLRELYRSKDPRTVRNSAPFERALATLLAASGLPEPQAALRSGVLTPEEEDAVRECVRTRGRALGINKLAAPARTLATALARKGLPDVRTALGKTRIDVYPLPRANRDGVAVTLPHASPA